MSDNLTPQDDDKRTFSEELEVAGNQLVERVKELIEEGNVRRLIIRNPDGKTLIEIPLTVGAVAGGTLLYVFGPVIAAVAVIGALVVRLKIEIVREIGEGDVIEKPKVESTTKSGPDGK